MAIEFMGKNFVYAGLIPEGEENIKRIILTRGPHTKTCAKAKPVTCGISGGCYYERNYS